MTGNFARGTGMLRHDERRSRLVVADARRRELGLAVGARPLAERALALRALRRLRDASAQPGDAATRREQDRRLC